MILVTQRYRAEVDDAGVLVDGGRRGDCVAACLASVFELPITTFPPHDSWQWLSGWLRIYYPGVDTVKRDYNERRDQADHHPGYWIASTESARYKVPCVHCSEGGRTQAPHWYARSECPWCASTGLTPGRHAIVMKGGQREWDPHPDADWDAPLTFVGETLFVVSDIARLTRRTVPAAFEGATA